MNSNDTVRLFDLILNQAGSGKLGPEDVDLLISRASIDLFSEFVGITLDYQPGRPVPPLSQGITQKASDALDPFYTRYVVNFNPLGIGSYPIDYLIYDNSRNTIFTNPAECNGTAKIETGPIKVLKGNAVPFRTSSRIIPPTLELPAIQFIGGNQIEIWPKSIKAISFNYYRAPKNFYWGRDYDQAKEVYFYNPSDPLNQPLEWLDMHQNAVVLKALMYAGVNIREAELIQAAELLKERTT